MSRRLSLTLAIMVLGLAACEQTVSLNDRGMDGGLKGTGGGSATGGSAGPTDASSGGGTGGGHCSGSPQQIGFTPDQPQVAVVLDRSSGMASTSLSSQPGDTELNAALTALLAQIYNYTPTSGGQGHGNNHATIGFSYIDFPDTASDCNATTGCCAGQAVQTNGYQDFYNAAYNKCGTDACVQSADRPVAAALSRAQGALPPLPNGQSGERFILLVTDGSPAATKVCSTNAPSDCQDAISVVQDLANDQGIETYIVGVGNQADDSCLINMATAERNSGNLSAYTNAPSDIAIGSALGSILQTISLNACRLTLSPAVTNASQLSVTYNQALVGPDKTNGWSLDSTGTRLHLYGSLCASFVNTESGPSGLQISQTSCTQHAP